MSLSKEPVLAEPMLQLLECGNGEDVKNSFLIHEDCGLGYNAMSQILHCHANQLSNEIKG